MRPSSREVNLQRAELDQKGRTTDFLTLADRYDPPTRNRRMRAIDLEHEREQVLLAVSAQRERVNAILHFDLCDQAGMNLGQFRVDPVASALTI